MSKTEKLNLTFTILGPVVVIGFLSWCAWSFNIRLTVEMQAADKRVADGYVSKAWFEQTTSGTNKRLDDISAEVNEVQRDVATLRGEMSTTIRTGR